jgi:sugar phosphate isomerase/epimerase
MGGSMMSGSPSVEAAGVPGVSVAGIPASMPAHWTEKHMHKRIAVHEVSFPAEMDIGAILTWAAQYDIPSIGLFSLRRTNGWGEAVAKVAASPVSVAYLSHASMFTLDDPESWDASTARLKETIDAAKAMGAPMVYGTTGPAGRLDFEEAVEALCRAIVPAREYAAEQGVKLLTETTNPLLGFTHFLHTFRDTVAVAAAAGIGLCLDLHPTWHEPRLRAQFAEVIGQISLVQVSDHVPRNMTVSRDVIGEGIIPIEGLLKTLFDAGYDGPVDLELFGRPSETALQDIQKSTERLTTILNNIGA